MKFLSATLLLLALAVAPLSADTVSAPQHEFTLTLLHDNDLHGHIFPFAYTEVGRSAVEKASVGGAARRATLVRELRGSIHNPTLLVDAGDTFTRGPLWNAYHGLADVDSMNDVGYDLAALGNNEFKDRDGVEIQDAAGSQADLLQVIKNARFSWICANARDEKGAFIEGVQPYVVRLVGGVRVGFLGLTTPASANYPQTKGWTISDPIAVAQQWIPEARKHCDVLIAVTHLGVKLDQQLAAKTTGIDAIVGGHSHTFLYKPLVVANADGTNVPIVQDGEFGVNLGRARLHFITDNSGHWSLATFHDELIPVDENVKDAPDVAEELAPYRKPFDVVVGHIPLASTPDGRAKQTTQIMLDAIRQQANVDIALNPTLGGMWDVFHHSDVTRFDVFAALPFHNDAAVASLTGARITSFLQAHPNMQSSGNITQIDPQKSYRVGFMDFVAKDTFKLQAPQLQDTGLDLRDVVIAYLGAAAQSGKQ